MNVNVKMNIVYGLFNQAPPDAEVPEEDSWFYNDPFRVFPELPDAIKARDAAIVSRKELEEAGHFQNLAPGTTIVIKQQTMIFLPYEDVKDL